MASFHMDKVGKLVALLSDSKRGQQVKDVVRSQALRSVQDWRNRMYLERESLVALMERICT